MHSVKIFLLKSELGIGKPMVISTESAGYTYLKIKNKNQLVQNVREKVNTHTKVA